MRIQPGRPLGRAAGGPASRCTAPAARARATCRSRVPPAPGMSAWRGRATSPAGRPCGSCAACRCGRCAPARPRGGSGRASGTRCPCGTRACASPRRRTARGPRRSCGSMRLLAATRPCRPARGQRAIGTCQWSGVEIITASMSVPREQFAEVPVSVAALERPPGDRFGVDGLDPLLRLSSRQLSTSQTATTCTPGTAMNSGMLSAMACRPVPMNPSVMRSLGASAPNRRPGRRSGAVAPTPAAAAAPRNCRRFSPKASPGDCSRMKTCAFPGHRAPLRRRAGRDQGVSGRWPAPFCRNGACSAMPEGATWARQAARPIMATHDFTRTTAHRARSPRTRPDPVRSGQHPGDGHPPVAYRGCASISACPR